MIKSSLLKNHLATILFSDNMTEIKPVHSINNVIPEAHSILRVIDSLLQDRQYLDYVFDSKKAMYKIYFKEKVKFIIRYTGDNRARRF